MKLNQRHAQDLVVRVAEYYSSTFFRLFQKSQEIKNQLLIFELQKKIVIVSSSIYFCVEILVFLYFSLVIFKNIGKLLLLISLSNNKVQNIFQQKPFS